MKHNKYYKRFFLIFFASTFTLNSFCETTEKKELISDYSWIFGLSLNFVPKKNYENLELTNSASSHLEFGILKKTPDFFLYLSPELYFGSYTKIKDTSIQVDFNAYGLNFVYAKIIYEFNYINLAPLLGISFKRSNGVTHDYDLFTALKEEKEQSPFKYNHLKIKTKEITILLGIFSFFQKTPKSKIKGYIFEMIFSQDIYSSRKITYFETKKTTHPFLYNENSIRDKKLENNISFSLKVSF